MKRKKKQEDKTIWWIGILSILISFAWCYWGLMPLFEEIDIMIIFAILLDALIVSILLTIAINFKFDVAWVIVITHIITCIIVMLFVFPMIKFLANLV